jgi:isoquinoline 1-oxidoreductase subunit beta
MKGRIRKILRRTFLIGSTAIVGGVAFGVFQASRPLANPLQPGPGETTLNPYILIDAQGVTIIAPRAEMGQGIHSTLAAMVAEELDVAWEEIRVIHGPAAQAYYNGAMMGAAMPFRDYAMTDFQHGLAGTMGNVGKVLGLQVTGGSTSARDGFEKMRHAGASARETLKRAAADRLGVAAETLRTENGKVIAPGGTEIAYVDLAAEAAAIDPPRVELRPRSAWKYLGQSMPRIDMEAKAKGTATFGIDIRLPGMKFATVKMNPRRAGMASFDATAALAMPGVEHVMDLGDGIAVVANNTWLAFQAAEMVEIVWQDAPYPATTAALSEAIGAAFATKANSVLRDDGNVERPVDGGTVVTAEYHVPWLAHATMEPMNATALYTGDTLEVWAGSQAPLMLRDRCAAVTGLKPDRVIIHTPMMGGSFGRRSESDFARYAAVVARGMPGVPVQVTWSREEDMRHDFYRPAAMARFRGVVKDGEAVTLDGAIAAPSTTRIASRRLAGFAPPGADKGHVEGAFDQPYGIPNFRIAGHLADLDVPIGFWRAVGNSYNGFFLDSFIDEMAHAAGRDPLEFRLQLVAREHAPSAGVIEAVAGMSGWSGQKTEGIGRGVGFTHSFGTPVAQVVEVVRMESGKIRIARAWIACDVGTALDPRNIEAQMISGAIFGFSAAVMGEITFEDGIVEQSNFHDYDALRMHNTPAFEVEILEANTHLGGVGEPGTPPSMPALANALFDLTGIRARELPLIKQFDLLI